jgi:hypothetical protein
MTSTEEQSRQCVALLRRVVSLWPKPEPEGPSAESLELSALLASDFDRSDLSNRVEGVSSIESVVVEPGTACVIFEDDAGYPHRAKMTLSQESKWLLLELKFQCPACFGDGVNNGQRCTICGGEGWGTS